MSTGEGSAGPTRSALDVALVVSDGDWGRTVASALSSAPENMEPRLTLEPGAITEAVGQADCIVFERDATRGDPPDVCRRLRSERDDVPIVVVLSAPGAWEGGDYPGAVSSYVRAANAPQPSRLARHIDTVVSAGRRPAQPTRFRDVLAEFPTPAALSAPDGTVVLTNSAFKATFGLAVELPAGLPDPTGADRLVVECETLDGPRSFRYTTAPVGGGSVCHVLRTQSAAPVRVPDVRLDPEDRETSEPSDPAADRLESLTDRQREVLETAVDGGFFERPKEHNSEELAARLDITRSTFCQHLRTAQRKVFDEVLE